MSVRGSYRAVTPAILQRLARMVGAGNVLADGESIGNYSHDETEDLAFPPDVVVRPGTAAEISAILSMAHAEKIPVTPRGGGTGLSGGALPVYGGIVLSMERLDRILEIDKANMVAIVEPGVITQRLHDAVEELGLFYPPDPASRGSSHLGGNLAECAGGPRGVKYGVTKDYVLGIEAVLPDGTIINTGGRVTKNVTGYNLTQLLVGSEGTLGIITRITLRLLSLPSHRALMLVAFSSLSDAAEAVAEIFQSGVTPSALELLERSAVTIAVDRLGKSFPNADAAAQLFVEVDGNYEETILHDLEKINLVVERFRAINIVVAEDRLKREQLWTLRRGIGEAVKSISTYKEEDTVVPRTKLPALITGVKRICAQYAIESVCYGHAGDGNIHVNILKGGLADAAWTENLDRAIREILTLTVELGGTISGEHGIGLTQKGFMPLALSTAELNLMKGIKALVDPHAILNPGKIFPESPGAGS